MSFIGLISDTHGLLRPEAVTALEGAERILHAGDIGDDRILGELRRIAPVDAVRGNNDREAWAELIEPVLVTSALGLSIGMLHDLKEVERYPVLGGCNVIISGHSHRPQVEERGGILYVNPGSAGRRRFRLPITLARLRVSGGVAEAEIVNLLQ